MKKGMKIGLIIIAFIVVFLVGLYLGNWSGDLADEKDISLGASSYAINWSTHNCFDYFCGKDGYNCDLNQTRIKCNEIIGGIK